MGHQSPPQELNQIRHGPPESRLGPPTYHIGDISIKFPMKWCCILKKSSCLWIQWCLGKNFVGQHLLLYYSITPWLHDSMTPWLLLHDTMTSWLHDSMTSLLHYSITPLLHYSITPSFHYSMTPWLHDSMTPWLHDSMTPWLHDTGL